MSQQIAYCFLPCLHDCTHRAWENKERSGCLERAGGWTDTGIWQAVGGALQSTGGWRGKGLLSQDFCPRGSYLEDYPHLTSFLVSVFITKTLESSTTLGPYTWILTNKDFKKAS